MIRLGINERISTAVFSFVFFCVASSLGQLAEPGETRAPSLFGSEEKKQSAAPTDQTSHIQNAIIEGIQLSSEPGEAEHEKIVSCYFIFRDKPTSYFYESKPRENKIVFEFNDTELGSSPVPTMQESPIQGFRLEQAKVDVNADVKGLTPEWHDVIRVTFHMYGIPEISVKDEYSVISFSFKWSTDPDKVKDYAVVDQSKRAKAILFSTGGGVALAAGGWAVYQVFFAPPPEPDVDPILDATDLPSHPDPK